LVFGSGIPALDLAFGGSIMRSVRFLALAAVFCSTPIAAQAQLPASAGTLDQILSKIASRETQEMQLIRKHSPLVETYIQKVRIVESDGTWIPDGDRYFIGRADFSKGVDLRPLPAPSDSSGHHMFASLTHLFDFGAEFLPEGFLQMVFPDMTGLDQRNYSLDFVRREFLGEVRTLVFDVKPKPNSGKGRFRGRIWVEDQDYTIVRFNGTYTGHEFSQWNFHFDSWRVNTGPNLWLPAFIYSEQSVARYPMLKAQTYKAQTRLWAYDAGRSRVEEELSKVLVESATPVVDQSHQSNDLSPIEEQRAWYHQADDNALEKLQRLGLIAPQGEVDKILDTVVNNLEVTNSLDTHIQCRVLLTSTMESFSMGDTIVLSRGLIDVLPDEPSLAAMLAKEMGYILTTHRKPDTHFAFYDQLQFGDKQIFQHFDFERKPAEDAAATAKAAELLKNSPYKDQLGTAQMFMTELRDRGREIPNLISPRLGDAGLLKLTVGAEKSAESESAGHVVALPLGGRIKIDPWDDTLALLKTGAEESVTGRDKLPFEVTPFMIYLTRVPAENPKSSQLRISSAPPRLTP
jgi:outer membrane lipoprotein-sorting protein